MMYLTQHTGDSLEAGERSYCRRVLSLRRPVRPRSTHPPVGPFRCGRTGASVVPPAIKAYARFFAHWLMDKRKF